MSGHLIIKEIVQETWNGPLPIKGAANVFANGDSQQETLKQHPLRAALSPDNCEHIQKAKTGSYLINMPGLNSQASDWAAVWPEADIQCCWTSVSSFGKYWFNKDPQQELRIFILDCLVDISEHSTLPRPWWYEKQQIEWHFQALTLCCWEKSPHN